MEDVCRGCKNKQIRFEKCLLDLLNVLGILAHMLILKKAGGTPDAEIRTILRQIKLCDLGLIPEFIQKYLFKPVSNSMLLSPIDNRYLHQKFLP